MTLRESLLTAALLAATSYLVPAQGAFQNLGFEAANVSGYSPGSSNVPMTNALPGWSGYYSTASVTNQATAWYDGISLGGAIISVIDSNAPAFRPLQGSFSAFLFGGGNGPLYSSTISQTGLVPTGTESLRFDAYVSGAPFVVTLGGQTISMTPLQAFSNYTLYGGNVPATLSGQIATLTFTEPPATGVQPSMFELDNIQFSNQPTPEPSVFAVSVLGALLVGWRALRRRR